MPDQVAGFPYWEVSFDESGNWNSPQTKDAFRTEVSGENLTDLFIFAHGWNNDEPMARNMYLHFYQLMGALVNDGAMPKRRTPTIGTVGVIWPAKLWADESIPGAPAGGAAGLGGQRQ